MRLSRLAVISFLILALACAVAFALFDRQMLASWVPYETQATRPLVFAHDAMPHARRLWSVLLPLIAVWSSCYIATLAALSRAGRSTQEIAARMIWLALPVLLLLFITAPLPFDSDQFAYVSYGDLTASHHNPYVPPANPASVPPAVRRIAVHWGNPIVPDVYGPAFTLSVAALLAPVVNGSVEVQVTLLRIAAGLAVILAAWLIWLITAGSELRAVALAAFALNPLVLVQAGLNAHNDIVLVLFALLAYLLAVRGRFMAAAVALAISAAVKFAAAPFVLPLLGAISYKRGNVFLAAIALAAFAATIIILAAPFGLSQSLLEPLKRLGSDQPHFAYYLWHAVRLIGIPALPIASFSAIIPLALLAAIIALTFLAARGRRNYPLEMAAVLLVFLAAKKVEPWYALVLTPLVVLPRFSAVAVFAGVTLSAQLLEEATFDGNFPYSAFYIASIVLSALIVLALEFRNIRAHRPTLIRSRERGRAIPRAGLERVPNPHDAQRF